MLSEATAQPDHHRGDPEHQECRQDRLADPLHQQAFSALTCSPGARAYYDRIRARGTSHHAALRQLSNRLVGILHGCLTSRTLYDENKAWPTTQPDSETA